MKNLSRLLEINEEFEEALATTIKISWKQVLDITVGDLISKYKSVLKNDKEEYKESFKKVLLYYISEKELKELIEKK